jgi:hypothetical protein
MSKARPQYSGTTLKGEFCHRRPPRSKFIGHCVKTIAKPLSSLDKDEMDVFINEVYRRTNGHNIFIGEWHSHPQIKPTPSPQDYQSMSERATEFPNELVFLIIGFVQFTPENLKNQSIGIFYSTEEETFILDDTPADENGRLLFNF